MSDVVRTRNWNVCKSPAAGSRSVNRFEWFKCFMTILNEFTGLVNRTLTSKTNLNLNVRQKKKTKFKLFSQLHYLQHIYGMKPHTNDTDHESTCSQQVEKKKEKKCGMKETEKFSSIEGHRLKNENVFESQRTLTGLFCKLWLASTIRHKRKRLEVNFVS